MNVHRNLRKQVFCLLQSDKNCGNKFLNLRAGSINMKINKDKCALCACLEMSETETNEDYIM